ncbi:MAG: DUF4865 family protein [Oceanospirillales bacterium]|nr:DUF4865 family protein [Oceanospirillales bacterium]
MISMQYRFVLPSDYDMGIIRARIRDKGHLLDHFPGLLFKAYLFADTQDDKNTAPLNLYAPFYLWQESEGMKRFLFSDGFSGLQHAFGRPRVKSWTPFTCAYKPALQGARYAARTVLNVAPSVSLEALEREETAYVQTQIEQQGVLACISAFDPDRWVVMRFSMYEADALEIAGADTELYQVGYVAPGGALKNQAGFCG